MSDNTTAVGLEAFSVERNGVAIEFSPTKISRGENRGGLYPCLNVTSENLSQVLSWLGNDVLISLIQPKLKQRCQNWYGEATVEADGTTAKPFDKDEFIKFASEFNARGESIKDLEQEKNDLTLEMATLPWGTPGVEVKAQELGMKIRILMTAIENKRRKKDDNETPAAPVTV